MKLGASNKIDDRHRPSEAGFQSGEELLADHQIKEELKVAVEEGKKAVNILVKPGVHLSHDTVVRVAEKHTMLFCSVKEPVVVGSTNRKHSVRWLPTSQK